MTGRTQATSLIFVFGATLWAVQSFAQINDYQSCMDKVVINPEAAFDDAVQWEGMGGGHAARHCALAALVEIGHYVEAAQGFEHLAQEVRADAGMKVQIMVQGARSWIAASNPDKAIGLMDTALNLVPNALNARLVRARAFGLQNELSDALVDLDYILNINPSLAEALVMRGSVYRQSDRFDDAMNDLNSALILDPNHPEGLLERGIVHRLQDRKAKARADWQHLIDTHPSTEAARLALNNLHSLNSGIEP